MKNQTQRSVTLTNITGRTGSVSGILVRPADAKALLVLAHGAGAGMNHSFMSDLTASLSTEGVGTLRFQFPYMEDGGKRPDSPKLATATIVAAVQWALNEMSDLPLFAGGKSFGGRMTTTAAALGMIPAVKGIVCFGFPLHQAKEPSIDRAAHLKDVEVPILLLQGTRDALADLPLMTKVARAHPLAKMHVVEGADHSFAVLKRSGRTTADVITELSRETGAFCHGLG
ncbi:MAG TPA: alpha/beta family hydrolase [Oligoflexus sp.]|uniref:alpha/beta hydrolase family protein n=1 Tax=Oligoflexus sp. TaxID=1971216 RepID=UPI002D5E1C02|nr:alpha/beta family hydrolase [Oligoflexus sp.]HYX34529.1 alpha/beta family hydrolase [Oligoflexus sp.]